MRAEYKQTRDGSPVNAPKGERTRVVQDAALAFLAGGEASTDEIVRHLKAVGVLKKHAKKGIVAAYLCYKDRFTYGTDGLWRATKKQAA